MVKLHNMFKKTGGKDHGISKNAKIRNVPEGLLKNVISAARRFWQRTP